MKPLSEKSYVDQAMKNGKGVTWLDDERIPFSGMDDLETWDYNMRASSERTPDIELGTTFSEEYGNPEHKWGYKKQASIPSLLNMDEETEKEMIEKLGSKQNFEKSKKEQLKGKDIPKGGYGRMDIGIGKPGEKQEYRKTTKRNRHITGIERQEIL